METESITSRTISACRERAVGHLDEPPPVAQFVKYASVSNRRRQPEGSTTAPRAPSSAPNRLRTDAETTTNTPTNPEKKKNTPPSYNNNNNADDNVDVMSSYDDRVPMDRADIIKLIHIGIASFLPQATTSAFSGLTPTLLTSLVGNMQTAGSVSAFVVGAGAFIALFATPIMSQLMDMFGRRTFGIISALKALAIALPMVAGGIIVHQNNGGMHGEALTGSALNSFKICLGFWFMATFFKAATFSSQGVVAVGDIFRNAHHRSIGIGIYQATLSAGSFAVFIGASLPLMTGSILIACIGIAGVAYNALFFPETCDLEKNAITAMETGQQQRREANHADGAESDRDQLLGGRHPSRREEHSSTTRRCFYDETEGSKSNDNNAINTSRTSIQNVQQEEAFAVHYRPRRIQVCVSPFKGIKTVREDKPALVALLILCCFIFSEITAGDVMGFYLSKKLVFTPQDLSIIQMEMVIIQMVASLVLVPIAGRYLSCSSLATISSLLIAASLVLIGLAEAKFVVFIALALSACAIVAMPALVAVITRKAKTSQQVSLVMNSVMAINFALSASGGIGGGLLFSLLPPNLLFLTFIVAAAFTIPMFCLSIYLRVLLRREEEEELVEGTEMP